MRKIQEAAILYSTIDKLMRVWTVACRLAVQTSKRVLMQWRILMSVKMKSCSGETIATCTRKYNVRISLSRGKFRMFFS